MPKFFIQKEDIQGNYIVLRHDTHHILNVLRKGVGDQLLLCDGESHDYTAEIISLGSGDSEIVFRILSKEDSQAEAGLFITLFQALPKGDKMELILQKCTEIGVSEFVPFESEFSIIHLDEKKRASKIERWQRIVEGAAKQSGRGLIPKVQPILPFSKVADCFSGLDEVLFFNAQEEAMGLSDLLKNREKTPRHLGIIIGAEGGFSEGEAASFMEKGAHSVSLGPRILRTETAGLVAASIVLYEFGYLS